MQHRLTASITPSIASQAAPHPPSVGVDLTILTSPRGFGYTPSVRIGDVIETKKRGGELKPEEIRYFVEEFSAGRIPDYQASALLMAIWFAGMTPAETTQLTQSMADSGDRVDLSRVEGPIVDKHSTGGVGDSTTLVVAPLVAACDVRMAKMSGRGLGHTGGTLDKLESIPGFRVDLDAASFAEAVNRCGLSVVGQTSDLVPADKKMYGLRDVTGTIDSIPLIASSIMSKKIAAGADAVLLDVKWGSGAFLKEPRDAIALANTMVRIGSLSALKTVALVTDMNQPLGRSVGNALDVKEALHLLRGEEAGDLLTLSIAIATELVLLSGVVSSRTAAETNVRKALSSGDALERFRCMIEAQGGEPRVVDDPMLLPHAASTLTVRATTSGTIDTIDAEQIGKAAQSLGAGRQKKIDRIDPSVGIVVRSRLGDEVRKGDELAILHVNSSDVADGAALRCGRAFSIVQTADSDYQSSDRRPLILERITA